MPRQTPFITFLLIVLLSGAIVPGGSIVIKSSDLNIEPGAEVRVDGILAGIAPCKIDFKTGTRHKCLTKSSDGTVIVFFLTSRELEKSQEADHFPAWFLDPPSLQSDFTDYVHLTPATAASATLSDAIGQAEARIRKRTMGVGINRYNTIKESAGNQMLDSSKSKYYPKLTRGQMDSLNDVNGGAMVASSLSRASDVTFLEYEIQKIGEGYRVYVLGGQERNRN